jgi:hypothetical protein
MAALYKHSANVSSVNVIASVLLVIVSGLTMSEIHFWSMEASQNKSNVTNRFGDRDFMLAVCTCFLINSNRFEVIRDFRSLKNGGNPFPVHGSIEHQK